jgi:hypothetical protein
MGTVRRVHAASQRQARACIRDHTVLPASCTPPRMIDLGPITTHSTAVTHRAPHFTYSEGMEVVSTRQLLEQV